MNASEENDNDNDNEETPNEGVERALRIGQLRYEVEKLAGEPVGENVAPGTPLDLQEQFWENVLAYESAPQIKLEDLLHRRLGFRTERLEELESDEAVHKALWELINALAAIRVFICFTDHLSDRELYQLLQKEVLSAETAEMEEGAGWNDNFDMSEIPTSDGTEAFDIYLTYYADDETREEWENEFPEMTIPAKASAPYDRDRLLPSIEDRSS